MNRKNATRDSRLSRQGETRKDRAMEERHVTQNRELSDSERLDMFRQQFFQHTLPDLPRIPGYHVCWLTTQNPRDPIHARLRLGYEPVKASDIAGWEHASLKSGEWEGCIGVNEMVAFKLPLHLYEAYMAEAHHHQPLAEEQKLRAAPEMIKEEVAARGGKGNVSITEEEGMAELGKAPDLPRFADVHGEGGPDS